MAKKRALFISSRPIYPIIGGDQIRTEQQMLFLKEIYDVDVVFLTPNKKEDLSLYPSDVRVKNFYLPVWRSWVNTFIGIFGSLPLQVNYYLHNPMKKWIKTHNKDYEVVFCNNIRTAEYAIPLNGIKKVLDFVDAISMNYEKAAKQNKGLKRILYRIDHNRCRKYEYKLLSVFDRCAIISDVDRKYILS